LGAIIEPKTILAIDKKSRGGMKFHKQIEDKEAKRWLKALKKK